MRSDDLVSQFEASFGEYLRLRGVSNLTREQYLSKGKELYRRVGVTEHIGPERLLHECQKFVADFPRQVWVCRSVVKHYLFCTGNKGVYQDFLDTMGRNLRQPPRRQLNKAVPVDQLRAILARLPAELALMLKIEYESCFRIGAVLSMRKKDYSWDAGNEKVLISLVDKGNKPRNRFITPSTSLELEMLAFDKEPNDRVFSGWNYRKVDYILKKHSAGITTHTMRHSRTMHLLDDGVDIRIVKDLMGHESLNTTMQYAEIQANKSREIIEHSTPVL